MKLVKRTSRVYAVASDGKEKVYCSWGNIGVKRRAHISLKPNVAEDSQSLFKILKTEDGKLFLGDLMFSEDNDGVYFDEQYKEVLYLRNGKGYRLKDGEECELTDAILDEIVSEYEGVMNNVYSENNFKMELLRFAHQVLADKNPREYNVLLSYFGELKFESSSCQECQTIVMKNMLYMIFIMDLYSIENIIKSDFGNVLDDYFNGKKYISELSIGTKTNEILSIPKVVMTYMKKANLVNGEMMGIMRELNSIIGVDGINILTEFIEKIEILYRTNKLLSYTKFLSVFKLVPDYKPALLRDYVIRNIVNANTLDIAEILGGIEDYFKMCNDMNIEPEKTPSDLIEAHDRLKSKYTVFKQEHKNESFIEKTNTYSNYLNFLPENKEYTILVPKDIADIAREGELMNHCVGSYVDKVIEGTSLIFFLRKKNEIEKPLVTIELDNRDRLVQSKAKNNAMPSDKIMSFINLWVKNIASKNKIGKVA